jgi:hypothetical protein
MAGVYSVKRDVISRSVFSFRDVTSRPMFATDTCMMYYVAFAFNIWNFNNIFPLLHIFTWYDVTCNVELCKK